MDDVTTANNASGAPVWNIKAGISLILCITGLGFNGILVLTFLVNRHLWSPFNIYLFNLLFANLVYFSTESGFDIVANLYEVWWLNSACCTVYMYGWWVVSLVQLTTHPLIATNRIWALWAPINYRRHHGYQAAIGLCVVTWICGHIIGLWGLLADHLYYRKLENPKCEIDTETEVTQRVWMLIVQLISIAAVVTIVTAFPLIVYKDHQRKRIRGVVSGLNGIGNETTNGKGITQQKPEDAAGEEQHRSHAQPTVTLGTTLPRNPKERSNAHTLLLFVLTVSVFIFWSPSVFYYTVVAFIGYANPTVDSVVMIMFNVQSVLDPILFTLTLRSLRNTAINTICFWKR
ncbi:tyramine receptor 1-like [Paramacrobiotus metropolitanus]|uniref:tyramine receptor 1-like n=1 Tax=Paramacrobiotus metropolitanus TaxID=2943436 RepID=UPI00244595B3|nr:tyramine receptor 1-like [Paramacrobiotus metropolitanus]